MAIERHPRQPAVIAHLQVDGGIGVAAVAEVLLPRHDHRSVGAEVDGGAGQRALGVHHTVRDGRVEVIAIENHPAIGIRSGVEAGDVRGELSRWRLHPRRRSVGIDAISTRRNVLPNQSTSRILSRPRTDSVVAIETIGKILLKEDGSASALNQLERTYPRCIPGNCFSSRQPHGPLSEGVEVMDPLTLNGQCRTQTQHGEVQLLHVFLICGPNYFDTTLFPPTHHRLLNIHRCD